MCVEEEESRKYAVGGYMEGRKERERRGEERERRGKESEEGRGEKR